MLKTDTDIQNWHLDKRVPIAIILTIFLQTFAFIYFVTAWKVEVESRLAVLEKISINTASQEARIIVLEQVTIRVSDDLTEIKNILRGQRLGNGAQQ
jgi:hypothetical protein